MALTRSKTWRLRALAVLGTGALLSSFFPSVSHAAPQLEMLVTVDSDGTESWDADDSAGNDSGPNNGIVRVNDTLNYRVQYNVNDSAGASYTGKNTTVKIKLPKGLYVESLPGICKQPGSSLNPETLPTPTLPLKSNSLDEMPEQELICNIGDKTNVSESFYLTAKVSNLVGNGTKLAVLEGSIRTDDASEVAASSLPTVTASSRLKWDISKNSVALKENSGYVYGPTNSECPWDKSRVCKLTAYTAQLSAPASGKGAMPAIGDITFTDDLSPAAMYPQLDAGKIATINADLEKYGSRAYPYDYYYMAAAPKVGFRGSTEANAVRDSGKVSINQAGPGTPAVFTVSNADTTLKTYPTQVLQPSGTAIPSDAAYAVTTSFIVYTPVDVIKDFGVSRDNTWTLATRNAFTNLGVNGLTASDVENSGDQPAWNDYRTTTPEVSIGAGFSKYFAGVPGQQGNMTPGEFSPSDSSYGEGPAGGATFRSGGITVAPTQDVQTQLLLVGTNPGLPGKVSAMMCDAWDNTRLRLESRTVPGSTEAAANFQRIGSNGSPVWVSGYNNALVGDKAAWATQADQVPAIKVQYSATPGGSEAASECGDDQGPWYDSPSDVPGNDSTLAARGVYSAVSRVRIYTVLPEPVAKNELVGSGVRMVVGISHEVVDSGRATGDILPNWSGVKRVNLEELSQENLLAHNAAWGRSSYDPSNHTGQYGDRLILAMAQVRVNKQVRKGTSGSFSSTPPQVTEGDVAQFQLSPSLTSAALVPGILKDVWVEDCLPGSLNYAEASVTPEVVSAGSTPSDAKRSACAAGETYIRWVFPKHEVNQAIPPIILTTEVSPTAKDGVYTNNVVVWAEDDASPLEKRTDQASVQLSNLAGIKLEKVALTPVVQVNREGQANNELNKWRVRITNTFPNPDAQAISNPDVIDMLPRNGLDDTSFNGTFTFDAASITHGTGAARILYTSATDVNQDPNDATNGSSGATAWCDAPAGGAVVSGTGSCPASAAEVTALRIQQPGSFGSGEYVEIELSMLGVGNLDGDVYSNVVFARTAGLALPVGPIKRAERAVGGEIGDYTWIDMNRNGIQDQLNGSDEPAAEGVSVKLTGTDDLGNAVNATTTTDAKGAYSFRGLRASDGSGYTVTFGSYADGFTSQTAGSDRAVDSNADTTTGASAPVILEKGAKDNTIDAGYVASGSLTVTKQVSGQGVVPFAEGGTFTFKAVCTLEGTEVLNKQDITVTIPKGATSADSETMNGIPAGSSCVVTETAASGSDPAAQLPSTTVTIGWDAGAKAGQAVKASLTNYYSAGIVKVSKSLEGDERAVANAADTEFTVQVTCQVPDASGAAGATVFSGDVKLKGGQTVTAKGPDGNDVKLPLGARCFGQETGTGGAASHSVTPSTWADGVVVDTGDPDALDELQISATNTFRNPAKVELSKELVSAEQNGGDLTVTYKVTVKNTGTLDSTYDLTDELKYGEGISVNEVSVTSVEPTGITPNPAFDGVADTMLVTGQEISGGAVHTYTIQVRGTAAFNVSATAADCTLDGGEKGTGLLNEAQAAWNGETLKGEACGSVTPPPAPTGELTVVKKIDGDAEAVEAAQGKQFKVNVVCQTENAAGERTEVFNGEVAVTGAETKKVLDDAGSPAKIPYGAHCFGTETDNGGAAESKVDYDSYDNAAVVGGTHTGEVSQLTLTATNTFRNPPALSITKEIVGSEQNGVDLTTTYRIVVSNSGSLAGTYDLADNLSYGDGISVVEASVASVDPSSVAVNSGFNGTTDKMLAKGQNIDGGASHTFTVKVQGKAVVGITATAADCTIDEGETGTGRLNKATMTFDGKEQTAEACAPVTPPPSPSESPTPTPSPTPQQSLTPTPSPTPPVMIRPKLPKTGQQ